MLPIAPAAARHHPTCELINDHGFAIANDVIHITGKQVLGLERIGDVVRPRILRVIKITHPDHLLGLGKAFIGERAAALFLVHLVITLRIDAVLTHLRSTHKS